MLNKAMLIGNLCADPEIRHTQSGSPVATLSVATNRKWKDKDGQKQEDAEFHRVVVWGSSADFCGKYLTKGGKVYVEGRLQTRDWEDKDGVKRYTTEIVAQTIQSLSPKQSDSGQGYGGNEQQEPYSGTGEEPPF